MGGTGQYGGRKHPFGVGTVAAESWLCHLRDVGQLTRLSVSQGPHLQNAGDGNTIKVVVLSCRITMRMNSVRECSYHGLFELESRV